MALSVKTPMNASQQMIVQLTLYAQTQLGLILALAIQDTLEMERHAVISMSA